MEGLCFGCAAKFGFFTKEHSCHKCGHAYCKSCIPHKVTLPGKDAKKQNHVCTPCYKLLQKPPNSETQKENMRNEGKYSPPENFKKRVAALHEKEQVKQGIKTSGCEQRYKADATSTNQAAKYKYLAPQDRDIAMRLEKLQEDRKKRDKPVLQQSEIEERLRKLQGFQPSADTTQQNTLTPPNKTMEEQYDDLLDEMTDEVALDARLEGKDITSHEAAGATASSSGGTQPSQTGSGMDPFLPSEDQLKQLTDDAKKLLGESCGSTDKPSYNITPTVPGEGDEHIEAENEARRLAEEANKLMEAARTELHLEDEAAKRGAEKDAKIARRLAELQNVTPVENTGGTADQTTGIHQLDIDIDEDEEKASQRLIQQLLEEDKLDAGVVSDGFQVPTMKVQPKPSNTPEGLEKPEFPDLKPDFSRPLIGHDELPWCCICNEDAVLRCMDCDDDLYCKRCFREGHKEFGIEVHTILPYKAPNK